MAALDDYFRPVSSLHVVMLAVPYIVPLEDWQAEFGGKRLKPVGSEAVPHRIDSLDCLLALWVSEASLDDGGR